jgi:signal transduction histidine kinase
MTQTVKSISANNLNLRINITGSKDELKELSKTFNDMMNRIEEAYNKQQQFVSDASHELRTPIAVIQGYANMLKRWGKNDPKVMQESIDAIANEAENIKDLVEKLLFIARSDKNTLKLQKEEFDLNELLVEVIKETEMIDDKHTFSQEVTGKILIFADKSRVKQTLRIIIDNSIKYTLEQGKISIKSATENDYAIISIIDNGIGISKEDLDNIFNRFYRSDKSRTKVNEGYGLGLYIAKIIVLRHKGKIKVRSKVDEGTEFKVYLPLGRLE